MDYSLVESCLSVLFMMWIVGYAMDWPSRAAEARRLRYPPREKKKAKVE